MNLSGSCIRKSKRNLPDSRETESETVTMDPNTHTIDSIRGSPNDVFPADGGIIATSRNNLIGAADIFFHQQLDGSQFLDLVPYNHPDFTNEESPDAIVWSSENPEDAPRYSHIPTRLRALEPFTTSIILITFPMFLDSNLSKTRPPDASNGSATITIN